MRGGARGFSLRRALAAEIIKLRTLPIGPAAVLGTVVLAAAISAALALQTVQDLEAGGVGRGGPALASGSADGIALQAVPFVQVGTILLGVLPVSHEYAGRQLRTSLAAVPSRCAVLAAKTIVVAIVALFAALLAMGAAWAAAALVLLGRGPEGAGPADPAESAVAILGDGESAAVILNEGETARVLGAVLYLVLMALFAHAAALVLRGLIPSLTAVLGLVLVVSPIAAGLSEHARWLPDRAAARLYAAGGASPDPALGSAPDSAPDPAFGVLVAAGWVAAVFVLGALRFARSEP